MTHEEILKLLHDSAWLDGELNFLFGRCAELSLHYKLEKFREAMNVCIDADILPEEARDLYEQGISRYLAKFRPH